MERPATQPSPNDRTRYLNIVYFVESARSHTIRVNLRYARWGLGLAAIVCAWSAGSIFWILTLQFQVSETRERLESSLTTIFDYQIKNDKVFEIAYPADQTNSYYSEAAQLASNNPVSDPSQAKNPAPHPEDKLTLAKTESPAQKTGEMPAAKSVDAPVGKAVPVVAAKMTDKPIEKIPAKPNTPEAQSTLTPVHATAAVADANVNSETPRANPSSEALVNITAAQISKTGNKIALVFDINNLSEERADGYIWAVAKFTMPDGQSTYVGAPQSLKLDPANGQIKSVKSAYRFSIQRFKKKDFEIKAPAIKDWKLAKLTIHFTDINRQKEDQINIPVDQLAVNSDVDKPYTEIKL